MFTFLFYIQHMQLTEEIPGYFIHSPFQKILWLLSHVNSVCLFIQGLKRNVIKDGNKTTVTNERQICFAESE